MHSCDIGRAYNYFCDEFERCLYATFTKQPIEHAPSHIDDMFAVYALQITIQSVVDKVFILYAMNTMKKKINEKNNEI